MSHVHHKTFFQPPWRSIRLIVTWLHCLACAHTALRFQWWKLSTSSLSLEQHNLLTHDHVGWCMFEHSMPVSNGIAQKWIWTLSNGIAQFYTTQLIIQFEFLTNFQTDPQLSRAASSDLDLTHLHHLRNPWACREIAALQCPVPPWANSWIVHHLQLVVCKSDSCATLFVSEINLSHLIIRCMPIVAITSKNTNTQNI